jgi:hypothetical protein
MFRTWTPVICLCQGRTIISPIESLGNCERPWTYFVRNLKSNFLSTFAASTFCVFVFYNELFLVKLIIVNLPMVAWEWYSLFLSAVVLLIKPAGRQMDMNCLVQSQLMYFLPGMSNQHACNFWLSCNLIFTYLGNFRSHTHLKADSSIMKQNKSYNNLC